MKLPTPRRLLTRASPAGLVGIAVLALVGCRKGTGSADDVCRFEFQQDQSTKTGRTVGAMVQDDAGEYTLHVVVRWAEKMGEDGTAPIGITLQGGWDHEGTPVTSSTGRLDAEQPVVDIHLDLPDAGLSGGYNDRRGPFAAAAVASVMRWAHGDSLDSGGCLLTDRVPAANVDDMYLVATSNGGNLAYSVLTDDSLTFPPVSGLVTWESPVAATFANVELGESPTVHEPGTCEWNQADGVLCDFPAEDLLSVADGRQSILCFDLDHDGTCAEETDVVVHGTESKETEELMLSPALRRAADDAGLALNGFASEEDADAWWFYRDASRRTDLFVEMNPDMPVIIVGSEVDHVIDTWTDHPHVHAIGEALQASGAFWTRLNPGKTWLAGNTTENEPNLPLALSGDEGQMLDEDAENPVEGALTAAVFELSDRNASGDWTGD